MKSLAVAWFQTGVLAAGAAFAADAAGPTFPIAPPGNTVRYTNEIGTILPGSVVRELEMTTGPTEQRHSKTYQWVELHGTKQNGEPYRVWMLCAAYPPPSMDSAQRDVARYILQEGTAEPQEFQDVFTGEAVLPSLGGWSALLPRSDGIGTAPVTLADPPERIHYLGHAYRRAAMTHASPSAPPPALIAKLAPGLLVGFPHNTRQSDETRRYDGSDYTTVRLTRSDYQEMAEAGINCVRVDAAQLPFIEDLDVFYWGIPPGTLPYPECLYRSRYLGPALFLDEPAVVTRDHVIRPKLRTDPAFRQALTPQIAWAAFAEHFRRASLEGAALELVQGLRARPDVDLGEMQFQQANLFSWETMVETAAYQLSQDRAVPSAMVFEPPGRVGTLRTLPEMDMTYGCQIPVDEPKSFTAIIYGFLRGAARLTGKTWGTSIYGAVDRTDAFWFLTHAYDLGATRFFFWEGDGLACVPYHECLTLARNLRAHARQYPDRDLDRLKRAAEVAILLPPGYGLGHVQLGKGSLWGLDELNLERRNARGVKYRVVMGNFFTEIERCLRLGIAFDLLCDLPDLKLPGYREVVRVREDGKVQVIAEGKTALLPMARTPARPAGRAPDLAVKLSSATGKKPLAVLATARVTEQTAPVFYTFGADSNGVYQNAVVAWELFGPSDLDHRFLTPPGLRPNVTKRTDGFEVTTRFQLDRAGAYRLRVATTDLAGRSCVRWVEIRVSE